jgi:hypothetical protein
MEQQYTLGPCHHTPASSLTDQIVENKTHIFGIQVGNTISIEPGPLSKCFLIAPNCHAVDFLFVVASEKVKSPK